MKELTKANLLTELRAAGVARGLGAAKLAIFLGCPRQLPSARCAGIDGNKHSIGWLRLIAWARRLGYRIEYRLVPLEETPIATTVRSADGRFEETTLHVAVPAGAFERMLGPKR